MGISLSTFIEDPYTYCIESLGDSEDTLFMYKPHHYVKSANSHDCQHCGKPCTIRTPCYKIVFTDKYGYIHETRFRLHHECAAMFIDSPEAITLMEAEALPNMCLWNGNDGYIVAE